MDLNGVAAETTSQASRASELHRARLPQTSWVPPVDKTDSDQKGSTQVPYLSAPAAHDLSVRYEWAIAEEHWTYDFSEMTMGGGLDCDSMNRVIKTHHQRTCNERCSVVSKLFRCRRPGNTREPSSYLPCLPDEATKAGAMGDAHNYRRRIQHRIGDHNLRSEEIWTAVSSVKLSCLSGALPQEGCRKICRGKHMGRWVL